MPYHNTSRQVGRIKKQSLTRHVLVKHGFPRRQQSQNMAKISESYILTLPHPQGHMMSVKCEEPIAPPVIVYGRWWFSPDKITDCPRFCTDFPPIFAHGGCLCTINSLSDRLLTQGWPNSHISLSCLSVWGELHQNTTVNPKKCYLLTQKLSVAAIIVAQNLTMCRFLISASPIICYLCFTSEILIADLLINLFLPKH